MTPKSVKSVNGAQGPRGSCMVMLVLAIAALLSSGCCSVFGIDCDSASVKFHVSNSSSTDAIVLFVDGEEVGSVSPEWSKDIDVDVDNVNAFVVEVRDDDKVTVLGGKTLSINAATQQVDISYLNGVVYISVNPQRGLRAADPEADCCPDDPAKRLLDGAYRSGRRLLGK